MEVEDLGEEIWVEEEVVLEDMMILSGKHESLCCLSFGFIAMSYQILLRLIRRQCL